MSQILSNHSKSTHHYQNKVLLRTIVEHFIGLMTLEMGTLDIEVTGPSSQDNPIDQALIFLNDKKLLPRVIESKARAVVIPQDWLAEIDRLVIKDKTLLSTPQTYLCMAKVNARFFQLPYLKKPFADENTHPTAVIHPSAKVAKSAIVGPGAVISAFTTVGEGTFIGANCIIEAHTSIGENCFIHPLVYLGHNCQVGNRVEIKPNSTIASDGYGYAHDEHGNHHRIPHYGAVIIEDDVHIGANVNIDRGTFEPAVIGAGTKIDNHCHFGHNVKIGKNCLITAGMLVAGSVTIGDRCVFGGRTTVNGHITITSDCMFAGLSGIANDVTQPGKYGGFPISEFRDFLKIQASLSSLPTLRKNVVQLMKKIGLKSSLS